MNNAKILYENPKIYRQYHRKRRNSIHANVFYFIIIIMIKIMIIIIIIIIVIAVVVLVVVVVVVVTVIIIDVLFVFIISDKLSISSKTHRKKLHIC